MIDYAYDIQNASLAEIRELINRTEIENNPVLGRSLFTGDGKQTQWYVAPPGFYIYPDSFSVTVNDVAASYTLDSVSGIVTMDSIPAVDAVGVCQFTAVAFPDFQIDAAINRTIPNMFPQFWVAERYLLTADGSTYEFEVPDEIEVVTSVDYQTASGTGGWSKQSRKRFTIEPDGTSTIIRYYTAPGAGTLRVHTVKRPNTFTYEDQTLSSLGLPKRALAPLISGTVYRLLMSKAALRIRTDVAVATMGTGTVFPSMMNQVASNWLMRYQFELQSMRMRPWMIT